MTFQVMTASLLKEGRVAYLQLDGNASRWTSDISNATAVALNDIARLEKAAQISESQNVVIAPYAIDVARTDTGLKAASRREQIRAAGPTVRLPRDSSALDPVAITGQAATQHAA